MKECVKSYIYLKIKRHAQKSNKEFDCNFIKDYMDSLSDKDKISISKEISADFLNYSKINKEYNKKIDIA